MDKFAKAILTGNMDSPKPPEDILEKTAPTISPPAHYMSLEGMHGSVAVPDSKASFWRQMIAFFGPAVLVSVAYMDPGNWGTDLQGGAQFNMDCFGWSAWPA
jgi:hypothetical protein